LNTKEDILKNVGNQIVDEPTVWLLTFFKISSFCAEERNSNRFETTWGWL